jgi:hypothetical protein
VGEIRTVNSRVVCVWWRPQVCLPGNINAINVGASAFLSSHSHSIYAPSHTSSHSYCHLFIFSQPSRLSSSKHSFHRRIDQPLLHTQTYFPRINTGFCTQTPVNNHHQHHHHVLKLVLVRPGHQGCLHIPSLHILNQYVYLPIVCLSWL